MIFEALMPRLDVLSVVFAFVQCVVPRLCPLRDERKRDGENQKCSRLHLPYYDCVIAGFVIQGKNHPRGRSVHCGEPSATIRYPRTGILIAVIRKEGSLESRIDGFTRKSRGGGYSIEWRSGGPRVAPCEREREKGCQGDQCDPGGTGHGVAP